MILFIFSGHCNRDHTDLIKDKWPLCQPCSYYFPTEASLATHNNQKHNNGAAISYKPEVKLLNATFRFARNSFLIFSLLTAFLLPVLLIHFRADWLPMLASQVGSTTDHI